MGGCADYTDSVGKWEGVLIIPTVWEGLGGCADYTDSVGRSGRVC